MTTIQVRYIGVKPRQTDCLAGTGTVWNGPGDVQTVPLKAWEKFSKHPTVYELVEADPSEGAGGVTLGQADGLEAMSAEDLHALAKERGVSVHHKAGPAKVIEALRAAA